MYIILKKILALCEDNTIKAAIYFCLRIEGLSPLFYKSVTLVISN